MSTPTLINWGDEIKPNSDLAWDWTHLGFLPVDGTAALALVILSRDGSRRILRATNAAIARETHYPDHAILKEPKESYQNWEGMKRHAQWVKDDPAQTVLMLQWPKGDGLVGLRRMPGMFMPHGVIGGQTRPVEGPVSPITATSKIRDDISGIAGGWDTVWHSRYVFSDHLRQQVTGRLVDGLLANIERDIQTLLTDARPAENTYWKAKLPPLQVAAKTICGVCAGDPYVWARVLARNIDLNAFRVRLDQGQIPAVDMTTKPWQPGTTVASLTFPPNTDVNAKKELVARWHDTNKAVVENDLLRWYDEVVRDPEPTYLPTNDHFHKP